MKDTEIFKIIGIPVQTLQMWKKSGNYREFLYALLKSLPKEYIKSVRKRIETEKKEKDNFGKMF